MKAPQEEEEKEEEEEMYACMVLSDEGGRLVSCVWVACCHYMVTVMPSALSLATTVGSMPVQPEASIDFRQGKVTNAVNAASVGGVGWW